MPHIAQSLPPEQEWRAIVDNTPEHCRSRVADITQAHSEALAGYFYDSMMEHGQASAFLSHEIVHQRLAHSMQRWIGELFQHPMVDPAVLVAHQRHVGEVHARIQLPIHLVARGARLLKHGIFARLAGVFDTEEAHLQALAYVGQLIDLALELMTESFLRGSQRGARTDEAYRLFSLGQNMSVERERQRSVLLEWSQEILFTLHRHLHPGVLPSLSTSEFGLWFNHKACAMFEGSPEIDLIHEIIDRVDHQLLPQLCGPGASPASTPQWVSQLQAELESLKFQLATLFERQLEVENGRDTLTRLLNRRFLTTVMNREIQHSNERKTQFALLLIDIDHFKRINDSHGHDAGDLVLQQAATLILNCVRNGDFVFRYGGEELLVMLVEIHPDVALRIAQTLRQRFEDTEFLIGQGRTVRATISVGVAFYDGHPDHQYLVKQADEAMYEAKQTGRNRVCVATPPAP